MIQFSDPQIVGPYLPYFWNEADPRPAAEQVNESYVFGGWQPMQGFSLIRNAAGTLWGISYPGDPVLWELSHATLRDETIVLFPHDWVAIIQLDGTFEVARLD